MSFRKTVGREDLEIEPIEPYTEEEVKNLIDEGKTFNEHFPRHVIRKRGTGEDLAEFEIL